MQATQTATGESLVSEYLRLLLVGTGGTFAFYWFLQLATHEAAIGLASLGLFVMFASVVTVKTTSRIALLAILAVALGVLGTLAWRGETRLDISGHFPPFSPVAAYVYATGLSILVLIRLNLPNIDGHQREPGGRWSNGSLALLVPVGLATLLVYMIAWPAMQWMLGWGEFGLPTTMDDRLTLGQEIRIRTAKLSVFLIFVAVGGSFGSFLHVIADTIPRGLGIPLRSSACPVCKSKIRRLDNVPIFSYLILKGRCRDCGTEIPIRYLWAELSMAILFAGFFLFELVNGAANLPGFRVVSYTGIVWVILYTKWDIVGIVAFHLFLFTTILAALYATWQQHRMPWYYWFAPFALSFGLPLVFPDLLPMKLTTLESVSPASVNALTSLAGGLAGIACAIFVSKIFSWQHDVGQVGGEQEITVEQSNERECGGRENCFRSSLRELVPAMGLLGVGLGWQAVLGSTAYFLLLAVLLMSQRIGRNWFAANGLLLFILIAAVVHQFTWKYLVEFARPFWLHQNSHWTVACGFSAAVFAGLFLVSRGWKTYLLRVDLK